MHPAQLQVREFLTDVVDAPRAPARPEIRDATLRARLIAEEAAETVAGLVGDEAAVGILVEFAKKTHRPPHRDADIVEVVDGLCDLIYVAYGCAEALGVDLEPYFDIVHAANMKKTGAAIDGHGKRGKKPAGWVDPKHEIARRLTYARALWR